MHIKGYNVPISYTQTQYKTKVTTYKYITVQRLQHTRTHYSTKVTMSQHQAHKQIMEQRLQTHYTKSSFVDNQMLNVKALMLSMLGKTFSRHCVIFCYFSQNLIRHLKCQIQFSEENKKKYCHCGLLKLHSVLSVKIVPGKMSDVQHWLVII